MNSEIIFLPTPNWFISQPADLNEQDSMLATCALNSIILTDTRFECHIGTIKDAHSKRLHAVSFYKIPTFDYLASCSEDLEIKIWNFKSRCLSTHHKFHQNPPTCLDWIRVQSLDPTLLSCDIKGNIFKWNLNTNHHVRYFPENRPITQIKILENSFKTAIGYKHGSIVLLDSKSDQMSILAKLKNHEDSINCLLWCPKSQLDSSKVSEEIKCDNLEHVLASSSEDKTIRIWDTLKEIQLKNFKIPSSGSKTAQSKANQIHYVPLCWPKINLILTGSFKGDLFFIDLENLKGISANESMVKWNHFSALPGPQCHKKIIFDIIHSKDKIITLSLDRLLF
ncbi:gem-associated 5 [Brachionus plicatilis]|uniref:Gem-associated 5 n=1 Tax=Brachionus plicatilis TaxID=10195 RepID=A0A3M7QHK6_BRAPC|nr:gem-associated 5 [Brachionus plicatilis]